MKNSHMELPLLSSDIHISKNTRGSTIERLTLSKVQAQMRKFRIITGHYCLISAF